MTSLFVSPLGRPNVSGSIEHPFRTIKEATLLAMDGDTVFLRGGTWRERVTMVTPGVTLSAYPVAGGYEPVTVDGDGYRLPDVPGELGGVSQWGRWEAFNYAGLVELSADRCKVYGLNVRQSKGRGIEVGGASDTQRTTGNVVEDCTVADSRHAGIGAKYFNALTLRNNKNTNAGNFAPFRRPTAQGVPNNHPASCSFQVGTNLVIEDLESTNSWGEAIMLNNIVGFRVTRLRASNCMTGGIYINSSCNGFIDNWVCYYSDVGRTTVSEQIQAGVFLNRENHKSDWGLVENICHDITIRNGVSVNNDRGISLLGALGLFLFENISFIGNTIVRPSWKPKSGQASALFCAGQGVFRNISFDRNLICLTDPATQMPVTAPNDPNIHWGPNFWSHKPPVAQRNAGDVYGDPMLVDALATIAAGGINLENYRLRPNSPAAGFGFDVPVVVPPAQAARPMSALRQGTRAGIRIGVG